MKTSFQSLILGSQFNSQFGEGVASPLF